MDENNLSHIETDNRLQAHETTQPNNLALNNESLFKIVTYHPSTITSESKPNHQKKRHYSQPGISHLNNRPRRPQRSMATMEGMIYDPLKKEFRPRQGTGEFNERRSQQTNGPHDGRVSPANSFGDFGKNGIVSRRSSFPSENGGQSLFATSGYITRSSSIGNRSNIHNKISVASMRSFEDAYHPVPSTDAEKAKMFRSTLTTIMSTMYAILILTVGVIIYCADIFIKTPLSEMYCLYLIIVGFLYLLFLFVDIRTYINKAKKYHLEKVQFEDALASQNEINTINEEVTISISTKEIPIKPPQPPVHNYCFSAGRHAGSFYLKLGAAGFCLVHLVHSALFLNIEIVYLTSELDDDCGKVSVLILYILYPIYSFCQLFFIFKYSNVIILKCKGLGRFALMHCIGSSLCFWVWTIIRETVEALKIYARKSQDKPDKKYTWEDTEIVGRLNKIFNLSMLNDDNCTTAHNLNGMIEGFFPYLYPFTIEYSILIVGIFYILWSNIGNCNREADTEYKNDLTHKDDWGSYKSSNETEQCKAPTAIDDNGLVSNLTINIDCHSSNKGWFGGLLMLTLSIVCVIITYVSINTENLVTLGVVLKESWELFINLSILIAASIAYYQIRKLDVNLHPISKLDDLLLFICIPAFFMDASFTLVPAIIYENYLKIFGVIVLCVQVLVQTPFIIDALRRCSNSRELRRQKPGRELITFLIVCNVASWIFETFSIKNADTDDERYDFYGKVLWTILGHISLPLSMFYRFHSSVCLADIWKAAYVPGNQH